MKKFKQKNYALPLVAALGGRLATGAMIAGTGISAYQGAKANEEAKEQTEEMERHNRQMEKIAKEQAQQEQKNFGVIPPNLIKNAGGLAKDLWGIHGTGIKKAAGWGAGMAGLGYVGNRAAQSWKDHDEGNDKANSNFLKKAAIGTAVVGGGILAARKGLVGGKAVQNYMTTGKGGQALSSLKKAVNPIVRDETGAINKGATLGKVALNGSMAAMPVIGYAAQRGQEKDQVESQANYSEGEGSSTKKKILGGLAVAGTIAGGLYGARRGWLGAGAQKMVGNKMAQTGSYLQNFKSTRGLGDKLITSGADAYSTGQTKKVASMMERANKSFDATKFKNNLEMSRVNRALDNPASLKKGASETVDKVGSFFGFMGNKTGTKAVQNTAKTLQNSPSGSEWSKKVGDFMEQHKNTANVMAGVGALGAGSAALGLGDKAVKTTTRALDKDAYKMEDEQKQVVYSEKTQIKKGIKFYPKTGKRTKFLKKTTEISEPNYKEVSVAVSEKSFTKWDQTDQLKLMKDSDILAERKRPQSSLSLGKSAVGAGGGALAGALIGSRFKAGGTGALAGAAIGGMAGMDKQTREKTGIGAALGTAVGGLLGMRTGNWKSGAMLGGTLGGAAGAMTGVASGRKQNKENEFFNDRLEYAQRKAMKREKADWKNNMNNRGEYTY